MRAFCSALWHFAMQRDVTIYRFVQLQNQSLAVSRKAICETNHYIGRALRSALCVCISLIGMLSLRNGLLQNSAFLVIIVT